MTPLSTITLLAGRSRGMSTAARVSFATSGSRPSCPPFAQQGDAARVVTLLVLLLLLGRMPRLLLVVRRYDRSMRRMRGCTTPTAQRLDEEAGVSSRSLVPLAYMRVATPAAAAAAAARLVLLLHGAASWRLEDANPRAGRWVYSLWGSLGVHRAFTWRRQETSCIPSRLGRWTRVLRVVAGRHAWSQ